MCPWCFLIHLRSVVIEEWDHNWSVFRAMGPPPCWVLQQDDFIQDFISSLSFLHKQKRRWMKEYTGEMLWQEALSFVITSQWAGASVIAETCLLPVPTRVPWLEGQLPSTQLWPRGGEEFHSSLLSQSISALWTGARAEMPRQQHVATSKANWAWRQHWAIIALT